MSEWMSFASAMQVLATQKDLDGIGIVGDPKQLPPVVVSHTAKQNALGSYCQLSLIGFVLTHNLWTRVVTFTDNFRSHWHIISIVSQLFYNSRMIPSPQNNLASPFTSVLHALQQGICNGIFSKATADQRVIMVNVRTLSKQEKLGKSTINPGGSNAAIRIVDELVSTGVQSRAIGIISMYKADKNVIIARTASNPNFKGIPKATVDSFQGRENDVIVLHMVSAKANARPDPFGFVKDQRRLCVALSRAQSYLFIIGNFTHWEQTKRTFNWKDSGMRNFMRVIGKDSLMIDWPTSMEDITEV
jgi:superfamily I DNA and/or RNA helicase